MSDKHELRKGGDESEAGIHEPRQIIDTLCDLSSKECTSSLPSQISSEHKHVESQEQSYKPFTWTTIDAVRFPIILRGDCAYLSVRIVENKLLSKFPNTYPKNVRDKPPLISHYVSPREANILNNINRDYLASEFGEVPFTVKDLVVKMDDFVEFYATVKSTFKSK